MIITIGESVYDIIFCGGIPVSGVFGGSMFNVAVSLGRTSLQCAFAGFYADDFVGRQSKSFLESNGGDVSLFSCKPLAKSNLALAFLNENGIPNYSFYRDSKLKDVPDVLDLKNVTHLVLGSFFVLDASVFEGVKRIVEMAKHENVQILYDPNIRQKQVCNDENLLERITHFMKMADLVKMSDEDITSISSHESKAGWQSFMENIGVRQYIITQGSGAVLGVIHGETNSYRVEPVNVQSTVGAGDAFNAGVVYASVKHNVGLRELEQVIPYGIRFAADVCASSENYISKEFIKKL